MRPLLVKLKETSIVASEVETCWVRIEFPGRKLRNIGIIYRPPVDIDQTAIDLLDNMFLKFQKSLCTSEIICMGDFNIDFRKTLSTEYKILKEPEPKYQLIQHKIPTRITNRVKSTIDLIFSNMKYVTNAGVLHNEISDLLPVFLIKRKKHGD